MFTLYRIAFHAGIKIYRYNVNTFRDDSKRGDFFFFFFCSHLIRFTREKMYAYESIFKVIVKKMDLKTNGNRRKATK